jgi:hypothetical protein
MRPPSDNKLAKDTRTAHVVANMVLTHHILRRLACCICLLACLLAGGCNLTGSNRHAKSKILPTIPGWQVMEENYFMMELPRDLSRRKAEGFDSTVGKFRSSTMEVHYDVKDALVYDGRRARAQVAELQRQFKPDHVIREGGKGVIDVAGRLAYLQHEQHPKWKAAGYPYENVLQIFFPDPSGGNLSVLISYKTPDQLGDAVKILRSIRFRQ